jgi:hypothetical protein
MILGSANLGDVIGPLSSDDLMASLDRHQVARDWNDHASPYPVTFAWVFETPVRWDTPVAYKHPQGAVIWVKL